MIHFFFCLFLFLLKQDEQIVSPFWVNVCVSKRYRVSNFLTSHEFFINWFHKKWFMIHRQSHLRNFSLSSHKLIHCSLVNHIRIFSLSIITKVWDKKFSCILSFHWILNQENSKIKIFFPFKNLFSHNARFFSFSEL